MAESEEESPSGNQSMAESDEETVDNQHTVESDEEEEENHIVAELSEEIKEDEDDEETNEILEEYDRSVTFKSLGVVEALCEACEKLNWKHPSKIQRESIPLALQGKDIIALAETGSGKTGAFALPILQSLLQNPQPLFAVVLTPTRELAFQIGEQFEALGVNIGLKVAVIVGGIDMMTQSLTLAKKPHIIIATPGRLVDHLEHTKGFNLKPLRFLVMDEADRILNMDFEIEVDKILKVIPRNRRTFLFSATMTKKVQKLQRACLQNPVKVEVSTKYKTVDKLQQHYIFLPLKFKDVYLVYILNELSGNSFMVFCSTCLATQRVAFLLRNLGLNAVPLHGHMSQSKRLGALNKFRAKNRSILIGTDVASRGLDIPHVDVVINFDIPTRSKDYIHRVGRTARAGRSGTAITFVTQYDVELYQRIEYLIGMQLPIYKTEEEEVMTLMERVTEAQRFAKLQMTEVADGPTRGRKRDRTDDTEESLGVRKRMNKNKDRSGEKGKERGGGGGGGGRGGSSKRPRGGGSGRNKFRGGGSGKRGKSKGSNRGRR